WLPPIPSGEPRASMASCSKLGFEISERTVSRLMPKDRKATQTWMTFLRNHVGELVSIDFFTVATIRLRVLYVFIVLAYDRRRVILFIVTEHPTAVWAAQQIIEAFPEDRAAFYGSRSRRNLRRIFQIESRRNEHRADPHSARESLAELLRGAGDRKYSSRMSESRDRPQ